jgi:hypothetical protein
MEPKEGVKEVRAVLLLERSLFYQMTKELYVTGMLEDTLRSDFNENVFAT